MSGIPYGPEEDEIIRRLFPVNATHEVAALIDRTPTGVSQRAERLGVAKDPTYLATRAHRLNGREPASRKHQFRKGQAPHNKGRPQAEWLPNPGRGVRTRFKAGRPVHEAPNYQPIGTERVTKDGYLERKVTDDPAMYPARRWVAVHRIVWEAANGPVPSGLIVVFKPGRRTLNADEITLDRLECISRAENMRRNSYWNRLPPEVARLVQLRGALNRKINHRTRRNEEQGQ